MKRFLSVSNKKSRKIMEKIRCFFRKQKMFLNGKKGSNATPLLPDEIVEDHPDALKLRTRGELLAW
jgi:hypothetical protein